MLGNKLRESAHTAVVSSHFYIEANTSFVIERSWIDNRYDVSRTCEALETQIYEASGQGVSGHTMKHLAAAIIPRWLAYVRTAADTILQIRQQSSVSTRLHPRPITTHLRAVMGNVHHSPC